MKLSIKEKIWKLIQPLFIFLLLVTVAPFLIIHWAWRLIYGLWLNYRFRRRWKSEGKHILFIYSESPNWMEYIENRIVPSIKQKTVFLNWSKRSEWIKSTPLEAKALFYWGGDSEFNPMAIVFTPNWQVKTIRFHKAFKDYKHGKITLLKEKEAELYEYL